MLQFSHRLVEVSFAVWFFPGSWMPTRERTGWRRWQRRRHGEWKWCGKMQMRRTIFTALSALIRRTRRQRGIKAGVGWGTLNFGMVYSKLSLDTYWPLNVCRKVHLVKKFHYFIRLLVSSFHTLYRWMFAEAFWFELAYFFPVVSAVTIMSLETPASQAALESFSWHKTKMVSSFYVTVIMCAIMDRSWR